MVDLHPESAVFVTYDLAYATIAGCCDLCTIAHIKGDITLCLIKVRRLAHLAAYREACRYIAQRIGSIRLLLHVIFCIKGCLRFQKFILELFIFSLQNDITAGNVFKLGIQRQDLISVIFYLPRSLYNVCKSYKKDTNNYRRKYYHKIQCDMILSDITGSLRNYQQIIAPGLFLLLFFHFTPI